MYGRVFPADRLPGGVIAIEKKLELIASNLDTHEPK